MASIAKTELGTTDPLDICFGYDMIQGLSLDVGLSKTGAIFNVDISLLVVKLQASATYAMFVGVCGPRYAIKVFLDGATTDTSTGSSLALTASNDAMEAGMLFGIDVNFTIGCSIYNADFHWVWDGWHSHISRSWNQLVNVNFQAAIDLFSILITVIQKALDEGEGEGFKKVTNTIIGLSQAYGFFASSSNNFATGPYANATPMLTFPINLVPFLEDTPLAPIYALDELLQVIWGGFAIGPQIGLGMPCKVQMKNIGVGAATYTNLTNSSGQISATSSSPADASPTTMSVDFENTTNFILTVGIFAQIWALKIFSLGFSLNLDLLALFGISVTTGPFDNTSSNTIGQNLNSDPMSLAGGRKRVAFILDPIGATA